MADEETPMTEQAQLADIDAQIAEAQARKNALIAVPINEALQALTSDSMLSQIAILEALIQNSALPDEQRRALDGFLRVFGATRNSFDTKARQLV